MIINKIPLSVIRRNDISNATVVSSSFQYSGNTQTLSFKYGGVTLVKGTDYTVSGTDSAIDVGNYMVTITGIGDYTGTKTVSWSITKGYDYYGEYTIKVNGTTVPLDTLHECEVRSLGVNTDITVNVSYTFRGTIRPTDQSFVKLGVYSGTDYTKTFISESKGGQTASITYTVRFSSASGNARLAFENGSNNYRYAYAATVKLYAGS